MKLYILSATLVKHDVGQSTHSMIQGYHACESEDEAKGAFVSTAMEEKPGFSISQLLCMAVPNEAIAMVAAAPEAQK